MLDHCLPKQFVNKQVCAEKTCSIHSMIIELTSQLGQGQCCAIIKFTEWYSQQEMSINFRHHNLYTKNVVTSQNFKYAKYSIYQYNRQVSVYTSGNKCTAHYMQFVTKFFILNSRFILYSRRRYKLHLTDCILYQG